MSRGRDIAIITRDDNARALTLLPLLLIKNGQTRGADRSRGFHEGVAPGTFLDGEKLIVTPSRFTLAFFKVQRGYVPYQTYRYLGSTFFFLIETSRLNFN